MIKKIQDSGERGSKAQYYFQESKEHPVVLILSRKWLGSTQVLRYYFEQMIEQYPDIAVYIVYEEKNPAIIKELDAPELPTTYILSGGKAVEHFSGILSERKIEEKLKMALSA